MQSKQAITTGDSQGTDRAAQDKRTVNSDDSSQSSGHRSCSDLLLATRQEEGQPLGLGSLCCCHSYVRLPLWQQGATLAAYIKLPAG